MSPVFDSDKEIDGRYRIIREIGSGGTGVVYLAYHIALQKNVVLKKINAGIMDDSMLRHEADLLKNLHHTYLPQVYDFISFGGSVYTVIDYIEGSSLEAIIDAGSFPDLRTVQKWFVQMCQVLEYLHSRKPKIIHSDIKPGNILITPSGDICLIDFNISLDGAASVSGFSRYYASPEQVTAAYYEAYHGQKVRVDLRTDIYSLGATFYHLISGRVPDENGRSVPLCAMYGNDEAFFKVIDKCMAPNPDDRYISASDILLAVKNMYKQTAEYKRFNVLRFVSVLMGAVMICVGIWLCVYGSSVKTAEDFSKDYGKISAEYRRQNYEDVITDSLSLLNSPKYKQYLKNSRDSRSDLMFLLSSAYYVSEDYKSAAYYGEQALENKDWENQSECFMQYLTSLIRSGERSKAEREFQRASKNGLDSVDVDLLKMEFYLSDGEYDAVINQYESHKADRSYSENAYCMRLCAEAAEKLGDHAAQLDYRKKAYSLEPDGNNLRRLGEAYMDIAEIKSGSGDTAGAKENCIAAEQCYEKLVSGKYAICSDYVNLLHCCVNLEQKEQAEDVVRKMLAGFPDSYVAYAEAADFYGRQGNGEAAAEHARKAYSLMPSGELSDEDIYYKSLIERYLD